MNILVTGGQGYKGSVLVPLLLSEGYSVTSIDSGWFGDYLEDHRNLRKVNADIRNIEDIDLRGYSHVIHLANIANDPAVEIAPTLSWEVNVLGTDQLVRKAIKAGVSSFIYASSGSVYGISDKPRVTEEVEPVPISVYNKTKMIAERVLLSYSNEIRVHIVRPATVCGVSPRMRLDVAVNVLTYHALSSGKITLHGGGQIRPNIHINDMARLYLHLIKSEEIEVGIYNAGFENLSLREIAINIQRRVPCEITVEGSNDPRSYRLCSDKILRTGYRPQFTVANAIDDIIGAFQNKTLPSDSRTSTIKWMKHLLDSGTIY